MCTEQIPSFSVLLRRYPTAAGLTQEDVTERVRLSAHGISKLERGERRAPLVTVTCASGAGKAHLARGWPGTTGIGPIG